jgi:hypothetical protein
MAFFRHLLKCSLVLITDLSFRPYCLMYLLMTFAILFNTLEIFVFADDINIFRTVSSVPDRTLLQSDTDPIRGWCAGKCMKPNTDKIGDSNYVYFFLVYY